MKELLATARPIAMVLMIVMAVAAAVTYVLALKIGAMRDKIRTLRSALERDPTPVQLNEARRMWPAAMQITEKLQQGELQRMAHADENKMSAKFEVGKATCRFFIIVAVVCGAIMIASAIFNPT